MQRFWPSDRGPVSLLTSSFPHFVFLEPSAHWESVCSPQAQRRPPVRPASWDVLWVDGDVGSGQLVCCLGSLLCTEGQNHSVKYTRKSGRGLALQGFVFLPSFSLLWFQGQIRAGDLQRPMGHCEKACFTGIHTSILTFCIPSC